MKLGCTAILLISAATLSNAEVACTPDLVAERSDSIPDEVASDIGAALDTMAKVMGCEMPMLVSGTVGVQFEDGKDNGVLSGFYSDIKGMVEDPQNDGFWVVSKAGESGVYAVPFGAARIDNDPDGKLTLKLQQPLGFDVFSGGVSSLADQPGYILTDQLVAVSAGYWPSDRYEVTFLSEPSQGVVHRGSVPKEPTEWTAIIAGSVLPDYAIVSSANEVCGYEDAEVKVNKLAGSATFICRFKTP